VQIPPVFLQQILKKRVDFAEQDAGARSWVHGVVLGAVTLAGIFSGFLTPDRHGFGMLIFGQAIWFLIVAAGLWRLGPDAAVE
jgi:hypothetical protein